MTHKFDSEIHDLSVCKKLCKYSNFLFVYYLHICDSSGCLGEKRQTFRKSKMLHTIDPMGSTCKVLGFVFTHLGKNSSEGLDLRSVLT